MFVEFMFTVVFFFFFFFFWGGGGGGWMGDAIVVRYFMHNSIISETEVMNNKS